MGDDHVAISAGLLVKSDAIADVQRLGHVDLDMVDEIAIPDRLEEAIGEPEGQDVLRRLLAEEMVDAENLVFAEDGVQLRIERDCAFEIRAERLLHDDARALGEAGFVEHADRRERGVRRHAQIMNELAFPVAGQSRFVHRRLEGAGAGRHRDVVERRLEGRPALHARIAVVIPFDRLPGERAKRFDVEVFERNADDE